MTLFEIDFLQKLGVLLKEAFKFKKYKTMHPALAVFTGIFMIPLVLISFVLVAVVAVLEFFFSVLTSPVKYLHAVVHDEGKVVMHATQFIIYFISWPLVFMLYALMSFLIVLIVPIYALLSITVYIWTLGGFKFHLYMNKYEDISIETSGRCCWLSIVFIIVSSFISIIVPSIHGVIHFVDLYANYIENTFIESFVGSVYPMYLGIQILFASVYSLIGFSRYHRSDDSVKF